jgi:4-hydroxyphenylacetate 3-monooxygenase
MIRTGEEYRESIRDGRAVWMNGERVADVPAHPTFKPIADARARIYDLAHDAQAREVMSYVDEQSGQRNAIANRLPRTRQDWRDKRAAVDLVLAAAGGVVTRVGDETIGEMWSLFDGQDVLNEVDPRFSANIRRHIERSVTADPFHVSANTDPKGDRSKPPQEQDPDMLLHVVRETGAGIVVRGAKYETAAAYANQAFTKPTIANWGSSELSDYAVGFVLDMGNPRLKCICRTGFAGRAPAVDYPLSNRVDEVESLVIFDDVLIPWEDVLFYRHTRAASFIRANIDLLLREAGGALEDIVKVTIYLVDPRYRETVYRTAGRWLKGVHPVCTGLVVSALARPEWLAEIDVIAVRQSAATGP